MERCWRLGDGFTLAALIALAHRLDDLPLARDHFQCLGDILTKLGQVITATAGAGLGCWNDNAFAR